MPAVLAFILPPPGFFFILLIPCFIFALYAQFKVSGAYNRNSQIRSRGGITGREAAKAVMDQAGITDVEIEEIPGRLTDHYDPSRKVLCLSSDNYQGTSLAALGVAAHEAGHALQHKVGYSMLNLRMAIVPATQVVSGAIPFLYIFSIFVLGGYRSHLGTIVLDMLILCYTVLMLFQLITLPVEFDATRRAKVQLVNLGILDRDEMPGVNETLDAAALTYVAAFVGALLNLLYLLSARERR